MRTLSTLAAVAALALVTACGEKVQPIDLDTPTVASGVPAVSVTCPGGIYVSASGHGPVYINGSEANLNIVSDTYWEATGGGVTAQILRNVDGTATVTYTGPGGVNGVCT